MTESASRRRTYNEESVGASAEGRGKVSGSGKACEGRTRRGVMLVISGPSGVGKSTVVKRLLEDERYQLSISATTRNKRPGEEHGREYYFLSADEFKSWIAQGRFIEHVELFENYYGTPREPLEQAIACGKVYVLDIDVEGAIRLRKAGREGIYVLLVPPDMEALEARLRGRATETEEQLSRRVKHARWELDQKEYYDHVVVNDKLERTVGEIKTFVDKYFQDQ